jgi:hypothetical protein
VDGLESGGPHLNRGEAATEVGHLNVGVVRGAQSFVGTLSRCWRLTGLEVAWRWVFGVPALWLVLTQVRKVLVAVTGGTLDPASLGLDSALLNDPVGALTADPMGATGKFAHAIAMVLPGLERVGVWLAPVLVVGWVVVSSVGRTVMLRRADKALTARPLTLMALQAVRMVALAGVFWVWFEGVSWSGRYAINGPIAAGAEPELILYCALLIVLTIGVYTVWAFVSWVFLAAPLTAMLRGLGPLQSLRGTLGLGALRGKLVEVNLVMAIVKVALVVLAMTFSATPLPFQDVATPEFLAWWWAGVGLLYMLWSDFFHVARLVGYLGLWRAYEGEGKVREL